MKKRRFAKKEDAFKRLQKKIGYNFKNQSLLIQAMTHKSYGLKHYERLEFLGDSLLNCLMALLLYKQFPSEQEGDLSRVRAYLVKQQTLFEIANLLELPSCLLLGEGERHAGGANRLSILADAVEALLAAIFLDSGFDEVHRVVSQLFESSLKDLDPTTFGKDAKSLLQEFLQGHKLNLPKYKVIKKMGEAHNQAFEVECQIKELDIVVNGLGMSRRAAEQEAAQHAIDLIPDALQTHRIPAGNKVSIKKFLKKNMR